MTKTAVRKAKGIMAGIVAGSAVSLITFYSSKPKPAKTFRKKAAKALDAVGTVMQNIADITK
ncbi:MAG: hypothetical protein IJS45_02160 [Clostridia bacterium]|nr:hypothetical protein [Clostridia bacterium]